MTLNNDILFMCILSKALDSDPRPPGGSGK